MFTYHDRSTAPSESLPQIDQTIQSFGFFPKLHQVLAEAPAAYEVYSTAFNLFLSRTTLSPLEQQVVMMTANYFNRCHYCTAGHSMLMAMINLPEEHIEALREGRPLSDAKLEVLQGFTRELLMHRGHVGDEKLQRFLDAGYSRRQALEILVGLAAKLISNFTNALAHTELDEPVKVLAWVHPDDRWLHT